MQEKPSLPKSPLLSTGTRSTSPVESFLSRGHPKRSIYRVLLGVLSAVLLFPVDSAGLSTSIKLETEELRRAPNIKIHARRKSANTTITIAFKSPSSRSISWQGYLTLIDQNGKVLLNTVFPGEDIQRTLDEQTLRNWNWFEFRPAEVFRFTVANKLLNQSKFAWELGPRKNTQGLSYGSAIIHWAFLDVLADAGEKSLDNTEAE